MKAVSLPAFESVHKLARRLQAFPHLLRLLPDDSQCLFEQATLVLTNWRGRHGGVAFNGPNL